MSIHAKDHGFTRETILEKFSYDRDAGAFTNRKTGKVVGGKAYGWQYHRLVFDSMGSMAVHRAVWLLEVGRLPPSGYVIDHINGDKHDNRICNLRVASFRENSKNSSWRRDGKNAPPNDTRGYAIRCALDMHDSGASVQEISAELKGRRWGPHTEKWVRKVIETEQKEKQP